MKSSAPSRRILIVDDDPDIVANLCDILSDLGYQTDTASGSTQALALIDSNCYDVALLDFKMPGLDGASLCKEIRDRSSKTVAIMITAYAGCDGVQRAMDAGTSQVLRKPVDMSLLLPMIQQATSTS